MRNMRTRFLALILLTVTVLQALAVPDQAFGCETSMYGGRATSCPNGLAWQYDKNAGVLRRGGRPETVTRNGLQFRYTYVSRCENGISCQATRNCLPGGMRFNVLAFAIFPDGTQSQVWDHQDTVCVYPTQTVRQSQAVVATSLVRRRS